MQYVPVVSSTGKPLMPCHAARARQLVRKGRAVRRFNKGIFYIQLVDRADGALHRANPQKGGVRPPYGGTKSLDFKRGSWVKHPKWGVCYVGGTSKGRLSLHSLTTGKRLTQTANPEDCRFLCYASWRVFHA